MDGSPVPPISSADDNADKRASSEGEVTAAESAARAKSRSRRVAPRRRPRVEVKLDAKGRMLFGLMVAALHILSLIPDLVLYALGALGGLVAYCCDVRHVKIGMKNLAIAFPERSRRERKRILRASYVNMGRSAAEYIRLGGFFYRRLCRRVRYERFAYWDEIKRKYPGRGALILTAHFGNFELLPAAHAMHGYQISLVHHTQRFLAGDALISFVRSRAGVNTIRKHAAARAVLRGLRNGELIGVPFDQNAKRSEAIFVPFFGELAATASGLARLTVLAQAPVIPVFIVREPDGHHHRIEIQEEIPLARTADPGADMVENTRRFVKAVEDMVRRYPEQFLWTHRRYRTRPRGTAKIYG